MLLPGPYLHSLDWSPGLNILHDFQFLAKKKCSSKLIEESWSISSPPWVSYSSQFTGLISLLWLSERNWFWRCALPWAKRSGKMMHRTALASDTCWRRVSPPLRISPAKFSSLLFHMQSGLCKPFPSRMKKKKQKQNPSLQPIKEVSPELIKLMRKKINKGNYLKYTQENKQLIYWTICCATRCSDFKMQF